VIYKRAAVPTGNPEAKPNAILENVEFDGGNLALFYAGSNEAPRATPDADGN
jgi:hypothetical protein